MKTFAAAAILISLAGPSGLAQQQDNQVKTLTCGDRGGDRAHQCEIKEFPVGASSLNIDAGPNGGVSVKGWSRADVLVRARIDAQAESDAEARDLVSQVRVETSGGHIRATGPSGDRKQNWSVSYEIFAPHRTDVTAKTVNGGVRFSDLTGKLECHAVNGGISLARLAGDVKGETTNGGVKVELEGRHWTGSGLDVRTNNGGVKMEVPADYSARLDTGTVNGKLDIDFPAVVSGRISKQMSLNIGSGGTGIRAYTTNGSVKVTKKGT
jgi:hypothetical protein